MNILFSCYHVVQNCLFEPGYVMLPGSTIAPLDLVRYSRAFLGVQTISVKCKTFIKYKKGLIYFITIN